MLKVWMMIYMFFFVSNVLCLLTVTKQNTYSFYWFTLVFLINVQVRLFIFKKSSSLHVFTFWDFDQNVSKDSFKTALNDRYCSVLNFGSFYLIKSDHSGCFQPARLLKIQNLSMLHAYSGLHVYSEDKSTYLPIAIKH